MHKRSPTITVQELQARTTLTVEEAAAVLGIGRAAAYQAAQRGDLPTIQMGRRRLVPAARLLAMLGIHPTVTTTSTPAEGPHANNTHRHVLHHKDQRNPRPGLDPGDTTSNGTDAHEPW